MRRPFTPEEWASLVPWHVKSQVLNALDQRIANRRAQLGWLEEVDVPGNIAAAREYLKATAPDPDAAEHLAALRHAMPDTRGSHHDRQGRFTRRTA